MYIGSKRTSFLIAAVLAAISLLAGCQSLGRSHSLASGSAEEIVASLVQSRLLDNGIPSVSVAVIQGPDVIVQRAFGIADVANGRPAEPSTTYRLGSIGKQFTAVLVLKLVESGRLSLQDPIENHLAGLPPEWNAITIEQLLNHTSGLKGEFRDVSRRGEEVSAASLLEMATREPLAAEPGKRFIYSNAGFMLLGALIERIHGRPYGEVLRTEIADPLGLTTLRWCGDTDAQGATGYYRSMDGDLDPAPFTHPSQALGSGGICSTATDVGKWNRALHGGEVLSSASYEAMTTPRGISKRYGFGLNIRPAPWGNPAIVHDGQTAGFTAENAWYPAESLSVTLLYNAMPRVREDVSDAIGHSIVTEGNAPRAQLSTSSISPGQAEDGPARFTGEYVLAPGWSVIVTLEDGDLHVLPTGSPKQRLFLKEGTTYAVNSEDSETTVMFVTNANEPVREAILSQNGRTRTLRKLD